MIQTKQIKDQEPAFLPYIQKGERKRSRDGKSIYEMISDDFTEAEINHFRKQLPALFWKEQLV
jgi:hypothetical protein